MPLVLRIQKTEFHFTNTLYFIIQSEIGNSIHFSHLSQLSWANIMQTACLFIFIVNLIFLHNQLGKFLVLLKIFYHENFLFHKNKAKMQ